ncbi:hypothetical protein HYV71_03295 [Candidatus Uhrbacteria bacterium]|nr:hypothetical protein [Candidatus Uhrbacteria bacterium]
MITATNDIKTLQKEMMLLRSFLIGVAGNDHEGSYRPEFVTHILTAMDDRPIHRFRDARSFLKQLKA